MTYLVPIGLQLGPQGGATGGVDCTGWSASRIVGQWTRGDKLPTGRRIRLLTDEPVPDPRSPGLNLSQVHDVLWDRFGIWTDIYTGSRALRWAEYEALRKGGHLTVVQVGYAPIARSRFDAGRGFRGGHAIYEDRSQTLDSLADGRAPGVYRYAGPLLYPRSLMRQAAADLVIATDAKGRPSRRVGDGRVWCLVSADTAPDFRVRIKPRRGHRLRRVRIFLLKGGRIESYDVRTVHRPLDVPCSVPRAFRWPSRDNALRYLVQVDNPGAKLDGKWIHRHWADPIRAADTGGDPTLLDDLEALDADDPDESEPDIRNDVVPTHPDDPVPTEPQEA